MSDTLYTTKVGNDVVNDFADSARDAAKEAYVELIEALTSGRGLEQDVPPRLFT